MKEYRDQIDEIDKEMAKLLLKRLEICGKIAEYKKQNDLPIYDKEREEEVVANAVANGGEMGEYTKTLAHVVIGLSKRYQNEKVQ